MHPSVDGPLPSIASSAPTAPVDPIHPNFVFVLTDDLASNLVRYMPHVLALEHTGMTFTNYTVTDSLCCPSRASIFTGQFPHDTGVFTNSGPDGGFATFHSRNDEQRTFATALHAAGYRTALMGKYLNGYVPSARVDRRGHNTKVPASSGGSTWVPPGWSTWDVAGSGYDEFHYFLNENRKIFYYGVQPRDYMVDVLSRFGRRFIDDSVQGRAPFMLDIATFAPHDPYVPAPRDTHSFAGLHAPRGPAFDRIPAHAPRWLAHHRHLTRKAVENIDSGFRRRVQAVQSVDRMIGALERELVRTGQASNTYFVFSSDNGLHMGDYTLRPGKLTAFDTDVHVPLVIAGPGVRAGSRNSDLVQNIDLAPTFESLAGVRVPPWVDGRSLGPLLHGLHGQHVRWRKFALVEHHGGDYPPGDPDRQKAPQGDPSTYDALRTSAYTYVRYIDGEHEYYDRTRDPAEIDNVYASLSPKRQAELSEVALRLAGCHGAAQCFTEAAG